MNLRHGQLWQRLGLTVLSGILVASLAPATAAAPAGGQDTHGDMESADLSQSSTDSGVAAPVASQDRAASDGADASDASDSAESADSVDEATASSEEESADGVDAQVYTFPGTNGPTRIHILTTTGSADAILLESRGVFAMIDGAEGVGAPDGKDPRYPLREGIVPGWAGDTDWILDYMSNHGVTSSNLEFYLGTHAHSDHIDNADEIIRKFHPKVILSPEYSDAWITDKSRLWDNQWVYDNMMAAARWAQSTYGASIVQNIKDDNTHIALGDMDVQIIPTDPAENYKKTGVRDANLIAYTAKVSAFRLPGRRPRGRWWLRGPHRTDCWACRHAQGWSPRPADLELSGLHEGAEPLHDRPDRAGMVHPRQSDPERYSWGIVVGAADGYVVQCAHSLAHCYFRVLRHHIQRSVRRFLGA